MRRRIENLRRERPIIATEEGSGTAAEVSVASMLRMGTAGSGLLNHVVPESAVPKRLSARDQPD